MFVPSLALVYIKICALNCLAISMPYYELTSLSYFKSHLLPTMANNMFPCAFSEMSFTHFYTLSKVLRFAIE